MVPLPVRYANREETGTATNPPIVSISHAVNPLIPLTFQNKQRHKPSAPGLVSDSPHPVGGEGVGSSAPMSAGCARAKKPGGWIPRGSLRRSMDDLCLLAARFLCGPLSHVRRAPSAAMSAAVIRSGPNPGPLPGGRVENGCAGRRRPFPTVTSRADQKGGQGQASSKR